MTDRLRRALRQPAGRLAVVFSAVSALAFGLPAALGATWLVGDNLIQNFPLRVLVGIDLRHGHLPLWDPYLWSGSPLLAGFNAGAAYPTTVLFAVLPGALAWVLNQMAVELVAAAGVVALLRVLGRSWLAAGLAAAAFSFGGFMTAQGVHLDLVQAAAWLPWAFVALDRLAHRPAGRSAAPWIALLGTALGLMILSGRSSPSSTAPSSWPSTASGWSGAHRGPAVSRSSSVRPPGSCSACCWPPPSSCPGPPSRASPSGPSTPSPTSPLAP